MKKMIHPPHPGEILQEEFLKPLKLTQYRLAKDISVPSRRINEIVRGMRAISADTALRLARFFGTSAEFWLNLQAHYDLEVEKDKLENRLKLEVKIFKLSKAPIKRSCNSKRREDRIELIPLKPIKALRGSLKGIDIKVEREKA